jgi:hypothetical protein
MAALVIPVASLLLVVQASLLFPLMSGEFALLIAISVPVVSPMNRMSENGYAACHSQEAA